MDMLGMIKVWRWRFLLASVVFTILLSSLALLVRYEQSSRTASASLSTLGEKLSQMRIATGEMKRTLTEIRGLFPSGYGNKSANALLYDRVDDLKMLFPKAVMTISVPVEQPEGTSLSFSVKAVNASYNDFLTGLMYAQARTFPFVLINAVSIGYEQSNKGAMEYTVAGIISIPNQSINGERR